MEIFDVLMRSRPSLHAHIAYHPRPRHGNAGLGHHAGGDPPCGSSRERNHVRRVQEHPLQLSEGKHP
eukprot:15143302-Heterocapsa_arctica.AAC.1